MNDLCGDLVKRNLRPVGSTQEYDPKVVVVPLGMLRYPLGGRFQERLSVKVKRTIIFISFFLIKMRQYF